MSIKWVCSIIHAKMIALQLRRARLISNFLNLPIIYLPGILGSKLYDRHQKTFIWGDYKSLIRKNNYEYTHSSSDISGIGVQQLHRFTVIPGLVDSLITAPLKLVLEQALGYQDGIDLFFLAHDWRVDHRRLATQLDARIQHVKRLYGEHQKVLLIAHSASNCAIRYYLQSASRENRESIKKWYAFGPPWAGTFQSLSLMESGYYAGGCLFNGFSADDIASCPSAYQLLPHSPQLIDKYGKFVTGFDIYDEACWKTFHLGPYRPGNTYVSEQCQRVRARLAENLSSAKAFADCVSVRSRAEKSVPQTWFLSDSHLTVKRAVYDNGRLHFDVKTIQRHYPNLAALALSEGDDHLPLDGLLEGWDDVIVRDSEPHPFGENYVSICQARTHRALVSYPPNLQSLAFDIATINRKNNER